MKALKFTLLTLIIILSGCTFEDNDFFDETGTGGSMARFTIIGDHLYAVDEKSLHSFDISNPANITVRDRQSLNFGIETIFPSNNQLFLGSRDGMYIFSLDSPDKPEMLSFTSHFWSNDPVVVQGNYAYVTLRTADNSWREDNLLQIYNISNLYDPQRIGTFPLDGPKGLAIKENQLFICDKYALKIFTLNTPDEIDAENPDHEYPIRANDIIIKDSLLHVVADDGLYNFNYNRESLELIGKISIPFKK
jgi:hypothetical protein